MGEQKTGNAEHADTAAEPLEKAYQGEQWQDFGAGRESSLGCTVNGPQPESAWSKDKNIAGARLGRI